ncbi:hypothetical protein E2C01_012466 [Portunus trituberculatus]|uniref:Uncharacterized protein n=1 Tax=Portunus trituberculatus TaxID=210409 RepID=A0A5B7DDY2_PORTR|nr:hypothetical protein [Portunus trituberculatus]
MLGAWGVGHEHGAFEHGEAWAIPRKAMRAPEVTLRSCW